MTNDDLWALDVNAIHKRTGWARATIISLLKSGRLRHCKLNRRYYVAVTELEAFLRESGKGESK